MDNRYLVDLKDVADRHLLYPEEHAQEEELQLEHLRQRIRAAKEETDLRDGLLQAKFTSLVFRDPIVKQKIWLEKRLEIPF